MVVTVRTIADAQIIQSYLTGGITLHPSSSSTSSFSFINTKLDGSVAEWLACRLRHRKAWVQITAATLSGNSLRQTVHTHRASVHPAAKLVAALLRIARVTAGLAESNGSLPPGL